MYFWVVTADRDWLGPYLEARAQEVLDSLDVSAELFKTSYNDMTKAKQAYREQHPNYRRKNFRGG